MKHYPEGFKIALVEKYFLQPKQCIRNLARQAGVGKTTLYKWIADYHNMKGLETGVPSAGWTAHHCLQASSQLDEVSIGEYCRRHGIYRVHLEQWRISLMNGQKKVERQNSEEENKGLRKKILKLEQALAEAKALLELKKKAVLLLEESAGN